MEDHLFLPHDSPGPASSWLFSIPSFWTPQENKLFERALAVFDQDTPDRWLRVAALIPGKSPRDVQNKYRELLDDVTEIESGRVPIPGYLGAFDDSHRSRKKPSVFGRGGIDHERKKGVPWTEEEHRRFLMGLLKYGKGDWRSISRNFVISKTPTQVASHAQKYFIRQLPGGKDKRRPSIHDITTGSLVDSPSQSSQGGGPPNHCRNTNTLAVAQGLGINDDFVIFESNGGRNTFDVDAFGIQSFRGGGWMMPGLDSTRHEGI